ncbi:hypothetical protein L484_011906 [Morus notabilis]|uniref:Uncharacterized protein n=1 Tax=Morus notabilis TaxID=981085 RepID=W9RS03_9ROSA|nr:hypothetical protein L484_011906 [Morus notabilis]
MNKPLESKINLSGPFKSQILRLRSNTVLHKAPVHDLGAALSDGDNLRRRTVMTFLGGCH